MTTTLLHVGRVITPLAEIPDAALLLRDEIIEAVGPRDAIRLPAGAQEISATGKTAVPGFIDVHIHGAGGHDVMEGDAKTLGTVAKTIAQRGTTSFLATTITASPEATCRSVEGISKYIVTQHASEEARAEVLGIHFEGPFISPLRRGVHPAEWIKQPSEELLNKFLHAAAGNARLLTLAPEILGAMPCIDAARKAGLVVALGHTDATYEQARAAIARGARHAVHVYNAMR
ncbi:MAG TPA: amidohydrolase family protein, partial [Candidatus Methylomirabilis sp.]|nr:amidohydrolase family protein [Candidatus Methylomirabilis sp.]